MVLDGGKTETSLSGVLVDSTNKDHNHKSMDPYKELELYLARVIVSTHIPTFNKNKQTYKQTKNYFLLSHIP